MTSKVIEFPGGSDLIWQCSCGCQTHFIHDDWISCAGCGQDYPGGLWKLIINNEPASDDPMIVRTYAGEEFLIRRLQDEIDNPDVIGILLVYESGRTRSMVHLDRQGTEEQKRWWRQRCADFMNQIKVTE